MDLQFARTELNNGIKFGDERSILACDFFTKVDNALGSIRRCVENRKHRPERGCRCMSRYDDAVKDAAMSLSITADPSLEVVLSNYDVCGTVEAAAQNN